MQSRRQSHLHELECHPPVECPSGPVTADGGKCGRQHTIHPILLSQGNSPPGLCVINAQNSLSESLYDVTTICHSDGDNLGDLSLLIVLCSRQRRRGIVKAGSKRYLQEQNQEGFIGVKYSKESKSRPNTFSFINIGLHLNYFNI